MSFYLSCCNIIAELYMRTFIPLHFIFIYSEWFSWDMEKHRLVKSWISLSFILNITVRRNKEGTRVNIPRWANKQFEIAQTPNQAKEQHLNAVFSGDDEWCCDCLFVSLNVDSTWNTIVYNISSGDLIPYDVYSFFMK